MAKVDLLALTVRIESIKELWIDFLEPLFTSGYATSKLAIFDWKCAH